MGEKSRLDFGDTSPETSLMHSDGGTATVVKPDFSGWATRYGIKCSDDRTIKHGAFADQDEIQVPLVWSHGHDDVENVLGHVMLESRDEGIYAYGYFNNTPKAQNAKEIVAHGDVNSLSIFANQLKEKAKQVSHGIIREVSLVLARANPGAMIDNLELQHSDGGFVTIEDEAVIFSGEELAHGDDTQVPGEEDRQDKKTEDGNPASDDAKKDDEDGPTVQDVYDGMTDEQKEVVHTFVGAALDASATSDNDDETVAHSATDRGNNDDTKGRTMKRNVFESQNGGSGTQEKERRVVTRDEVREIAHAAMQGGSMKAAIEGFALKHGIEDIDILFPDAQTITSTPEFDARRVEWVRGVLGGINKRPFSRIKSVVADITHEEARARGYIKGTFKKEEWFGLAKRVTTPTTVYKKQKLDRDDIIDITDLDVVAWIKAEMRLMLDEELAICALIGDGRAPDDDDKIRDPAGANEGAGIRSILNDHDLYATTVTVPDTITDQSDPQAVVEQIMLQMENYKGSGSPTLYTTLGRVNRLLLAKDGMNRRLWRTRSDLAAELGVAAIVDVEAMQRTPDVFGIIVNLSDYSFGTDRGGDLAMFDDFDIDYNQYKYMIETRLSGALTKIRSAIVVRFADEGDVEVVPAAPTFNEATGDLDINDTAGVVYRRADTNAVVTSASVITLAPGQDLTITAEPDATHYFVNNVNDEWDFTREA